MSIVVGVGVAVDDRSVGVAVREARDLTAFVVEVFFFGAVGIGKALEASVIIVGIGEGLIESLNLATQDVLRKWTGRIHNWRQLLLTHPNVMDFLFYCVADSGGHNHRAEINNLFITVKSNNALLKQNKYHSV